MTLYTVPNLTDGLDDAIIGTAAAQSSFIPFLLFFVWGVVFFGGITSQKRRFGNVDFPMWATVSMLSTFLVAILMTIKEGIINLDTLIVVTVLTIFAGVWLFTSHTRNEV